MAYTLCLSWLVFKEFFSGHKRTDGIRRGTDHHARNNKLKCFSTHILHVVFFSLPMGRTCTVKSDLFLVLLNKSIASRCRCSSRNSNFYFSPPLPLIVYIASSFSFRVPPWHSSSESCTSVIMSTLTGDARTLAATTDSQIESALKRILSPRRITRLVGWSTLFFLFFLIFYSLFWTVRTG